MSKFAIVSRDSWQWSKIFGRVLNILWFQKQSCECTLVLNMVGLHKASNKIFHDRCLTVFWICIGFWICQGSICWCYTSFWIKFSIIDIWQDSEYASSFEYASVTQGFVENVPSYMFDRVLSILRLLNMLPPEYTRVVNMPRLRKVLCKLYFQWLEFWLG